MEKFFPFTVEMPNGMVALFREHDNDSWYEVDLIVTSKSDAIFRVYDIFDICYGGRGDHLRDVHIKGISSHITKHIKNRAIKLATLEYEAAREAERDKEIHLIADRIRCAALSQGGE